MLKLNTENRRTPVQRALGLLLASYLFTPSLALAAQKPQYLPPIAPRLDSAAFQQSGSGAQPAPAPSYSSTSYDAASDVATDAAPAANDRVKDLLRQALSKHNQGDLNGAARAFQQVLAIDPKNADANFNLGAMSEDKGDLPAALRYYQAAAAVNPGDSDVRDAISAVQQKMRQQQTAQQLQQKQQLRQIAQDAAAAYKAGNYDKAISDLQQVTNQAPNDANALFALGQAYRGKGQRGQARQLIAKAAAIDPGNQLYQATLSDLDHEMQQPSQVAQGPAPAPDYSRRGARDNGYNDQPGLQPYSDSGSPDIASAPEGQITPFTDQGAGSLYGHEAANNFAMGRGLGFGSGSGLGMGMGMGLGSLMGMGMLNGGVSRMGGAYYSGRGTRLVRNAAIGGLAGAAVGALTNMHGAGGMRAGAMRGALTGGIMGLITGF